MPAWRQARRAFPLEASDSPSYFRTGTASTRFVQIDDYVLSGLRTLCVKRKGRNLRPGDSAKWTREYFENLGLYRLRGTIRFPERPFWERAA